MDRLLCPWNSPSKNTGVGNHSVLQGTFPTKGSNPSLPHCRQILHHLSHQGKHVPAAMKLNMTTQTWCKVGAHYMLLPIFPSSESPAAEVSHIFGTRDQFHGRQFFHGWGCGLGMIQAHYIYCIFFFYYYYISSIDLRSLSARS